LQANNYATSKICRILSGALKYANWIKTQVPHKIYIHFSYFGTQQNKPKNINGQQEGVLYGLY